MFAIVIVLEMTFKWPWVSTFLLFQKDIALILALVSLLVMELVSIQWYTPVMLIWWQYTTANLLFIHKHLTTTQYT